MKSLKQLREDYEGFVPENFFSPEELMLEEKDEIQSEKERSLRSKKLVPSSKQMPSLLMFRRITYKIFPNKQVVALYYAKSIDKYLSVPFGGDGILNLREAVLLDTIDEDIKRPLSRGRREDRTTKREAACSRLAQVKKRLIAMKSTEAHSSKGEVNRAIKRWNCEESFQDKLNEARLHNEGIVGDTIEKGRQYLHDKLKDSKAFKVAQEVGHHLPGYGNVRAAKEKFAAKDYLGAAKETGKSLAKAAATGVATAVTGYVGTRALPGLIKGASKAKDAYDALTGSSNDQQSQQQKADEPMFKKMQTRPRVSGKIKTFSSGDIAKPASDNIRQSRLKSYDDQAVRQAKAQGIPVEENKMSDLRKMVSEGPEFKDLEINGRTVTINNGMAKRILEVYDSVNSKNKKIVENMLNEDLSTFKKLLNFSIRN